MPVTILPIIFDSIFFIFAGMNRLLVIFGLLCFTSGAFAQDYAKDTAGRKIFTWQLTNYFSRVDSATLDTSLLGFQIYNPNFKLNIFRSEEHTSELQSH